MSASPEPQAELPATDRDEVRAELDDLNDNGDTGINLDLGLSDDESVLSEVDEAQFEDFNPDDVDIEDRPALDVDAENLKLIGRHKRKRREDEEGGTRKRKEGRREKKKRQQRDSDAESAEGKQGRRRTAKSRREATPEDDETLSPEERRRRALDRAMDAAMKQKTRRRRKADGIDLEQMADQEIEDMRRRMTDAARIDAEARRQGQPAMHKLKMLPEVLNLLNRNQYTASLVDPEINLLEAVKFFLEPLDDGELPAYNIQRDLMDVLGKLPINKDSLVASGIGKVIVFYTKSKRPELKIKRQAERLLADWTRPILQRSDDYSKRVYEEVDFDPTRLVNRANIAQQTAEEARARELLPPRLANRARREMGHTSYSIVPRSTVVQDNKFARPVGASGEDRFRRMKARQLNAGKPSRR
ncbi:Transcription factor iws1 [Talaromyces atroroseus]|uniref:Transcription factor iws1 n=1 Tax=Talaromyces atroroseus TaxID=1441469 RepID=A0A225ALI6_TALAT|nr:Transcription factor iws1 [Talaromyces atroroseus]OKL55786.1 Transcription factor iws1 [Talaromyces atroroseus]